MKKTFFASLCLIFFACGEKKNSPPSFIPKPKNLEMSSGYFVVNQEVTLGNQIKMLSDSTLSSEAYFLQVKENEILLKASTDAGFFYGLQTILQAEENGKIPCMTISDEPRFGYRGMHLDVSRHFFSVEFIKKQLDLMAHYKLNRFHWHLTDGAGWRIEIKKYPRLTDFAAWRKGLWKEWRAGNRHYCDKMTAGAYGGFYTQEQAREIVEYAAARHIEVIPEIEMPGHSDEVLAAFPELSCAGKAYSGGDFCAGKEAIFEFLENVLSEIVEIFPSKFIHIGGDEASKENWKICKNCQNRIRQENLADVNGLQSYFVKRIENFLHSKNREIIGWNEIMDGGVSSSAVIMAWTEPEAGWQAARQGNRAIMVPGGFCYFDMYQANPATQPEAIGGFVPLKKVYSFEPAPADSLSAPERERILGVQANLWTEYVPSENHAEYMLYPRLLALSEVAWSDEKRDWENFKRRVNFHIPILKNKNFNVFELSSEPEITQIVDFENRKMRLKMSSERFPVEIRYTLDGSSPTAESPLYDGEIELSSAVLLRAALFQNGEKIADGVEQYYGFHKAFGKSIKYNNGGFGKAYSAGGEAALVDGLVGSFSYTDGRWQGFSADDLDVTIDLGAVEEISLVKATFMQLVGPWIYLPQEVEISASLDGEEFFNISKIINNMPKNTEMLILKDFSFSGKTSARYIRYRAKTCGKQDAWMFVDEIVVM